MSIEHGRGPAENEREVGEYDREAWERLKRERKPVFVIDEARKIGVPEDVVQQFGREAAETKEREDGADAAFRFMHYMKIGEPEERTALAKKSYQSYMDEGDYGYAMAIAQDAFGKESEEWKKANAANEAQKLFGARNIKIICLCRTCNLRKATQNLPCFQRISHEHLSYDPASH